jgi:hypothetical protein
MDLIIPSKLSVLAIQNYGISGSLFLQSLLDNHPNILMTPALYSHRFYDFWEKHNNKKLGEIIDLFMSCHAYWFSPEEAIKHHGLHQMGPEMNESIYVSPEIFRQALIQIIENHLQEFPLRKLFFIAIYLAYNYALDRETKEQIVIVFPIHSSPQRHASYLIEDFPDVKFIHVIREPIQNIGSAIKHIIYNQLPVNALECAFAVVINNHVKHWGNGYYTKGDRPYFKKIVNASRAVKLEDIHVKPKETIKMICQWINIPWDDCLVESTFNGKKWWNRPESPRVSGFSEKITDDKRYKDLLC